MKIIDESLLFKDKKSNFVNDNSQNNVVNRYSNLDLNQNNKSLILIPVQDHSKKYNEKFIAPLKLSNSTVSDNYEKRKKLQSSNKSSNSSSLTTIKKDYEVEKRWEKDASSSTNNSTLSLHIAAYEKSTESDVLSTGDKKNEDFERQKSEKMSNWENGKNSFTASSFNVQNPFEFPRQQNKKKAQKPELSQFKATQRLFRPYGTSDTYLQRASMSVPNVPRIGFRPNIYARPQTRTPTPAPPRPPVPSSRDRMLKPGFETSSTPYSRPSAHIRSQEKSPEPPPRNLGPYPILSNFMYTEEQLQNTPSHKHHNISYEEELTLRHAGTFFIKELCRRLNAPYTQKSAKISPRAMCVSMVYFHRFYMFHSLTTFNPFHLGTACLFLAAKCEECPRKLSHFSKQLYSMLHPDEAILENDELEPMNDLITTLENAVLSTLAFELAIDLPHVDIIQAHFTTNNDRLRKMAYHLTTDLLATTTLCIKYESRSLAAACFFVAACYLDINMEKEYGAKWFLKLDKNLTEDVLIKIVKSFISGLQECKPLLTAERIPHPRDPNRGELSKGVPVHNPQVTPENRLKNSSKESRPPNHDDRSRQRAVVHEDRPPPSSERRSREPAQPKEHRLPEPSKKERPRAPYDQARDRTADTVNKDQTRVPHERRTPDMPKPHRPKTRTPDSTLLQLSNDQKKMSQQERQKTSSRTPEAPAYESVKSSRGHRTPEGTELNRPKVPYEHSHDSKSLKAEALRQEISSTIYERRTPEASHRELNKIPKGQLRDHGASHSYEKHSLSGDSSLDRHKPQLEKQARERSKEIQNPHRSRDLEAPLLVPPPLPPPSSELRHKRKLPTEEEVPRKRPVDTSQILTSTKQRYEQVDFSLPPPPLPPPHDRRISLPIREQSESSLQKSNFPKVPTDSNPQQPTSHSDFRRDESRHSTHHRTERSIPSNHFGGSGSSRDTSLQHPQVQQQKDVRKRDMMQNFVPAQTHSSKSVNRHSQRSRTSDELEEGEIE